jgi:hypothetical protein
MSGPNQKKPGGKKHGKQSRKPEQPLNQKPNQLQGEKPEQLRSQKPEPLLSQTPEPVPSQKPVQPLSPKPEPVLSQKPVQPLSRAPEQLQSPKPEQPLSQKPAPLLSDKPDQLQSQKPMPLPDSKKQIDAAVASENLPSIDFQTIATAYGDYTKKSFAETKAYVEKLSGVRSLDKVVEIQTEFAKQAYETFVAESQKIRELYSGLAKQNLRPFEGFVARKNRSAH